MSSAIEPGLGGGGAAGAVRRKPRPRLSRFVYHVCLMGGRTGARSRAWSSRGRRLGAGIWEVLASALVLLAALDLHSPGESHDPLAALSGSHPEVYYPGASHPLAPQHAEAAAAAQRPFCPACLNRLQTGGAHHARQVDLLAPQFDERVPLASAPVPVARARRPPSARAPPLR